MNEINLVKLLITKEESVVEIRNFFIIKMNFYSKN
jgi:hypothetical protein